MSGRANGTPTSESAIAITHSTTTYQRAPGTYVRRTARSLVLLAPQARLPIRIAGSAADVWDMLETPATGRDLLTEAGRRLGAPGDSLAIDLTAALEILVEAHAVVVDS